MLQSDDHIRMLGQRQFAQNLRQLGRAEFGRSTSTGRELGQSDVHGFSKRDEDHRDLNPASPLKETAFVDARDHGGRMDISARLRYQWRHGQSSIKQLTN
jgi:hypothetical protein